MRFFSTRDLRNHSGMLRRSLKEDEVVLTANGKPFALVVSVEEDEVEEMTMLLRRVRAQQAVSRMRARWAERGVHLSEVDIDEEVRAVRLRREG